MENAKKVKRSQTLLHIFFIVLSLCIILPLVIMISSSLTSDEYLSSNGYQVLPLDFSTDAYEYLIQNAKSILRSYLITIVITVVGTVGSLTVICLLAYPIALTNLPGKKIITFLIVFSMLFNGGLVPTYIMYTQYFHIKNTIWALIFPSLFMNAFNVLLVRNFYITSVPRDLLDAAKIDGASEIRTLFSIVLPLSKPIIATVGIMQALAYWNDWFNGLLYLTDEKLYGIQTYLNQVQRNIQFLSHSELGQFFINNIELPEVSARMAIAVLAVLPVLCAYPFIHKLFIKGISEGAIKG